MTSFIFTDRAEHELFLKETDLNGISPNSMLITDLEDAKRLVREGLTLPLELASLGFEGFLMQQVDAPLEIISVLMDSCFLHKIPYAVTGIR